jgi:hypothetical protein
MPFGDGIIEHGFRQNSQALRIEDATSDEWQTLAEIAGKAGETTDRTLEHFEYWIDGLRRGRVAASPPPHLFYEQSNGRFRYKRDGEQPHGRRRQLVHQG